MLPSWRKHHWVTIKTQSQLKILEIENICILNMEELTSTDIQTQID